MGACHGNTSGAYSVLCRKTELAAISKPGAYTRLLSCHLTQVAQNIAHRTDKVYLLATYSTWHI
jgi:hypothetical protein